MTNIFLLIILVHFKILYKLWGINFLIQIYFPLLYLMEFVGVQNEHYSIYQCILYIKTDQIIDRNVMIFYKHIYEYVEVYSVYDINYYFLNQSK